MNKQSISLVQINYILLLIIVCSLLVSCDNDLKLFNKKKQSSDPIAEFIDPKHTLKNPSQLDLIPKNQADWRAIKGTGILRIIIPYSHQFNEFLPRKPLAYNNELKLIMRFAEHNGLEAVFVSIKNQANMLSLLDQGYGDVVVANLTILEHKKEKTNYTIPIDYSVEQLVVAQSNNNTFNLEHLKNLKIGAGEHTSFWQTSILLKENSRQDFEVIKLDKALSADNNFSQLVSGKLDAVIVDSNRMSLYAQYRDDIKAVLDLSKKRPIAWAVRKNNPQLLQQLNQYIKTEKLLRYKSDKRPGDLASIKKHHQIRLITRNNASTYFLWKNQLMGFEYDLIKHFAKQQKVSLKVLVAQDFKQMMEWLEQGQGDIISAGLIKTAEREKFSVDFTDPYLFVRELIVQRKDEQAITLLNELHQRTFHVRKSSSYWNTLTVLQEKLSKLDIQFTIKLVPESMETEEIIKHIVDGEYDLTLADSHITDIEKSWHSNLQTSLALTRKQGHRWIVRNNSKNLLAQLNKFIKKEYKQLYYNITYNKYFNNSRMLFTPDNLAQNNGTISPYDKLIKHLSRQYNFDWRLISAQVNKESQFNPKAESWAGAKGLLQVMPRTAHEVGISDLKKPENGLRAGMKYMDWITKQLSSDLPTDVRTWFTLAAYNAGLGHLKDARKLAAQQGLNPDLWFGHVEQAFLLLSKPKYHKKSRYGYVRGIEPVTYIKKIQALFALYNEKHPKKA